MALNLLGTFLYKVQGPTSMSELREAPVPVPSPQPLFVHQRVSDAFAFSTRDHEF